MKRFALGCVIAAALGTACAPAPRPEAAAAAPIAASIVRAETTELTAAFEAGGIVKARTTALIASRVAAPIVTVPVIPGDRVRRGATLVTLDARESAAGEARATAAAAAVVASARAAESDVLAAEAAMGLARVTRDRVATLFAQRSATQQELDQAAAALAAADAQAAAARARLTAAGAARDAAQAEAEGARISATYDVITAPFDGVVTSRQADPGTMALPGVPLLTLEDTSAFRLEISLDESRADGIAPGRSAEVQIDRPDGARWVPARVIEVARIDPASHAVVVKIELPVTTEWRSGAFGRARFAGPVRAALTVPASAIVRRGQLAFVFLLDPDGRTRLRPVSAGAVDGDRVEVLAGLREHDGVVDAPPPSLTDGARVAGASR